MSSVSGCLSLLRGHLPRRPDRHGAAGELVQDAMGSDAVPARKRRQKQRTPAASVFTSEQR